MGVRGMQERPVPVMVVDDHPALRAGLRSLIDSNSGLQVLLDVANGEATYAEYRNNRPDVLVMDLSMEGFGGIEAIRRIRVHSGARPRKRQFWCIPCMTRASCSTATARWVAARSTG